MRLMEKEFTFTVKDLLVIGVLTNIGSCVAATTEGIRSANATVRASAPNTADGGAAPLHSPLAVTLTSPMSYLNAKCVGLDGGYFVGDANADASQYNGYNSYLMVHCFNTDGGW